jgi:3-phenylpropionate/trans-cinnamate dioxygenase ferredoxin subunit
MRHIELSLDAIPRESLLRIEDGGAGIVVVRTGESVTAFEDVCPHAHWRLSEGEIVNGLLECPGHGWEFCPATGDCVTVPAHCLKPVTVTRLGQRIRLTSGAGSAAEPSVQIAADDQATV